MSLFGKDIGACKRAAPAPYSGQIDLADGSKRRIKPDPVFSLSFDHSSTGADAQAVVRSAVSLAEAVMRVFSRLLWGTAATAARNRSTFSNRGQLAQKRSMTALCCIERRNSPSSSSSSRARRNAGEIARWGHGASLLNSLMQMSVSGDTVPAFRGVFHGGRPPALEPANPAGPSRGPVGAVRRHRPLPLHLS